MQNRLTLVLSDACVVAQRSGVCVCVSRCRCVCVCLCKSRAKRCKKFGSKFNITMSVNLFGSERASAHEYRVSKLEEHTHTHTTAQLARGSLTLSHSKKNTDSRHTHTLETPPASATELNGTHTNKFHGSEEVTTERQRTCCVYLCKSSVRRGPQRDVDGGGWPWCGVW